MQPKHKKQIRRHKNVERFFKFCNTQFRLYNIHKKANTKEKAKHKKVNK